MIKLRSLVIGLALFAGGALAGITFRSHHWPSTAAAGTPGAEAGIRVALENARVAVKVIDLPPGARRPGRTRPTDELVLFCDEAHYQAVSADGKTEARDRTPGTAVWHSKGDVAPTLINSGSKPVHYYSISIK